MAAEGTRVRVHGRRRRSTAARTIVLRLLAAAAAVAACGFAVGVGFAGSPEKLAAGVRIQGVDVGGMTPAEAREALAGRARRLRHTPVTFTAGSRSWTIAPSELGVEADWGAAVDAARRQGDGFGPVRGFRRIGVRVFGADVVPPTRVWDQALSYEVRRLQREIDHPHVDAAVKLRGLHPVVVGGRDGTLLDKSEAARTIVRALASFSRTPTVLPVRADPQRVRRTDLRVAAARARRALSAPARLALGPTRWVVPRWRIAGLLDLPRNGSRALRIGGSGAERFFGRLARRIGRAPRNADFAVTSTGIRIVPDKDGLAVDVARTEAALLSAVVSPGARTARVTVTRQQASLTTADARAMGIKGMVGRYETIYGGEPNRIHNVQLVAHLIDRKLIAPGATFSFNQATGARTPEKGFREAPVIINGELQTGLGGGVCQVSTTVFNAAYEAGLAITERTNHSLYISHYPLARDATVNYPDTDLKFVNDTPHWLLLRTFVGPYSLAVSLYGTPVHRKVVSHTAPLVAAGDTPVTRIEDPSLYVGQSVTDTVGEPPRTTSVRRLVYSASGKLLHNDLWSSYYRGEATVIRVGTKPRPKPKPEPKPKQETTPPTTTPTTTTPTTTSPATTTPTTTTPTTTTPATTTPAPPAPSPNPPVKPPPIPVPGRLLP